MRGVEAVLLVASARRGAVRSGGAMVKLLTVAMGIFLRVVVSWRRGKKWREEAWGGRGLSARR